MSNSDHFEMIIDILNSEPDGSFFVKAEVLSDLGVNVRHLEEASGRTVRRRSILVKGENGLPFGEIEFEFLPKSVSK